MSGYTPGEWLAKADHEGGLCDAILGYGLTEKDLDKDAAPDLWNAIQEFRDTAGPKLSVLEMVAGRYEADEEE